MTDDIDMDAVSNVMDRRTAFIQAIAAGNDLIMTKNLFSYDRLLPQRAVCWVWSAIAQGVLREAQVSTAALRDCCGRGQWVTPAAPSVPGERGAQVDVALDRILPDPLKLAHDA